MGIPLKVTCRISWPNVSRTISVSLAGVGYGFVVAYFTNDGAVCHCDRWHRLLRCVLLVPRLELPNQHPSRHRCHSDAARLVVPVSPFSIQRSAAHMRTIDGQAGGSVRLIPNRVLGD